MADTIEGKIAEALFGRLSSLVLNPTMPISWPNVQFKPPHNHRYLRAQFAPNVANRTVALPTGLTAGTTYYIKTAPDADTFTVAATPDGSTTITWGSQSGTIRRLLSRAERRSFSSASS